MDGSIHTTPARELIVRRIYNRVNRHFCDVASHQLQRLTTGKITSHGRKVDAPKLNSDTFQSLLNSAHHFPMHGR
jgi:hypothetical protein